MNLRLVPTFFFECKAIFIHETEEIEQFATTVKGNKSECEKNWADEKFKVENSCAIKSLP